MPSTFSEAKSSPLTADGTSNGLVTLADNSSWLPGQLARLSNTDGPAASVEVVVVEQISTNQLRLRLATNPAVRGGGANLTAFTTAKASRINREGQVVRVDSPFIARTRA
jgi:hypothetical protein